MAEVVVSQSSLAASLIDEAKVFYNLNNTELGNRCSFGSSD